MLKVLLVPWAERMGWPLQGPCLVPGLGLPAHSVWLREARGQPGRSLGEEAGEQLIAKEKGHWKSQWQPCISEQVAAKVLCFPLLVKFQVIFKKMFIFCWRISAGGVPVPACTDLLGSLTQTSVVLPKSPPRLSLPLPSSVIRPCLFNTVDFSRVGQEFKLLRNISRWFMGIWKGFIDFSAWKKCHNTEAILGNLTTLLMNCCYLVMFKSQNRGSVVGESQDYELVRRCGNRTRCTECTI